MLNLFKRDKTEQSTEQQNSEDAKPGFFGRLRQGLGKTRQRLGGGLANLILGHKTIDEDLLKAIETQLLTADVGAAATETVIAQLTARLARKELKDPQALYQALQQDLLSVLAPCEQPLTISADHKPFVILMMGINGSGKTTTIGKLAKQLQQQGLKVLLAAGDTFRAAAIEQLQVWGERNQVPVIAQQAGSDSASVIYDAFASAKAKGCDVVLADTAGRLHTQDNLMSELQKITRVLAKLDPSAPHEVLLVLDAGIGQNAIAQAQQFHQAVPINGLVLTKMDGTAKGGAIFSIAKQLALPIRYVGVGEGIDDLRPFVAQDFVAALFETQEEAL